MNLVHVHTLQAVVKERGFSRAAEVLKLSQPAVSHHVRQLEAALGVRLLQRAGKMVVPTKAGELFLEHARRAIGELDVARESVLKLQGAIAGRIRIGSVATPAIYLLPPFLLRFRLLYPQIEVEVITGSTAQIVADVVHGELDIGLATLPISTRGIKVSPFWTDRWVAVSATDWKPKRRGSITPTELGRHPLIAYEREGAVARIVEDWFRHGRATPRIAMVLGNAEAMKRMAAAGLGLALLSGLSVRTEIKTGLLKRFALDPPLDRRVAIVQRELRQPVEAVDLVAKRLAEFGQRFRA